MNEYQSLSHSLQDFANSPIGWVLKIASGGCMVVLAWSVGVLALVFYLAL